VAGRWVRTSAFARGTRGCPTYTCVQASHHLTYCTVGSRISGGERVEAFAPGIGAVSEDFKRLTLRTSLVHRRSRWFAEKGYAAQLRSFFAGIHEGKLPEVTVRDGARATIGCLRMLESAKTFAPCALDLDAELRKHEREPLGGVV
jgi:hypothetical protein